MEQDNFVEQREEPKPKNRNPFNALIPRADYFFTPILLNINLLLFILMVISGISPTLPSSVSLRSWGANYRPDTMNGEPWRLFTSMFLHFGIIHLAVNMYSLYSLGELLEKFIGKWRFITLYLFRGLCGSAVSLWWHSESVSAGASGAIFGLFGVFAAIVTTNLIDPNSRKQLLRGVGLTILMNAAIGLWSGIDNSAHLGGFLSGILGGYLIFFDLKAFYQQRKKQYFGLVVAIILMIGVVIYFWMITPIPDENKTVKTLTDNQALLARFESNETKALTYWDKKDSVVTLNDFHANFTQPWQESLSIFDSLNQEGLKDEFNAQLPALRKYVLWRIEAGKYYERSIKENRPDFKDSAAAMMFTADKTSTTIQQELQTK